jgi:hypothetical protein
MIAEAMAWPEALFNIVLVISICTILIVALMAVGGKWDK